MSELNTQIPSEIKEKPYRSYYKDDWRCWCGKHSIDDYIKYLNAVFHTKSAHYSNDADWKGEKREVFHVETNADCLLMSEIRTVEFHGLMLSSMFANAKGKFSFLFEPTGWYE